MTFDFYMPVHMLTGEGCVQNNKEKLAALGTRCLIVTSKTAGRKSGALDDVLAALQDVPCTVFDEVEQNPLLLTCHRAGELARECGADFIVGIGGGSPLDAAKAVAVFAANKMANPMDIYKLDWKLPALPLALVGTTAGTGSEVGPAAVLTMPNGRKKSISHPQCYPRLAFGDVRYTLSLPLHFTVSTALDAFSHAAEGYFSSAANAMTDVYALAAMEVLSGALQELLDMKQTQKTQVAYALRERLYFASILAGLTLAKCGTSYCHTLGYFLTEQHGFAHGTACAVFLPHFLQRGAQHAPEKAQMLETRLHRTLADMCRIIEALNEYPRLRLDDSVLREVAARGVGTPNFRRALPSGFSEQDALQLLRERFAQ